jgi:SAM-dependent methyltransferase
VHEALHEGALEMRRRLGTAAFERSSFATEFARVPAVERDTWLDVVLGTSEIPPDSVQLPSGCVPYLPCAATTVWEAMLQAEVCESDLVVDLGAGIGRTATFIHLLTGARVVGIELQHHLAAAFRRLRDDLALERVAVVEGDAADLVADYPASVYFLYCPFGGERLARTLHHLDRHRRTRTIRVCCINLPLPPSFLKPVPGTDADLVIYHS